MTDTSALPTQCTVKDIWENIALFGPHLTATQVTISDLWKALAVFSKEDIQHLAVNPPFSKATIKQAWAWIGREGLNPPPEDNPHSSENNPPFEPVISRLRLKPTFETWRLLAKYALPVYEILEKNQYQDIIQSGTTKIGSQGRPKKIAFARLLTLYWAILYGKGKKSLLWLLSQDTSQDKALPPLCDFGFVGNATEQEQRTSNESNESDERKRVAASFRAFLQADHTGELYWWLRAAGLENDFLNENDADITRLNTIWENLPGPWQDMVRLLSGHLYQHSTGTNFGPFTTSGRQPYGLFWPFTRNERPNHDKAMWGIAFLHLYFKDKEGIGNKLRTFWKRLLELVTTSNAGDIQKEEINRLTGSQDNAQNNTQDNEKKTLISIITSLLQSAPPNENANPEGEGPSSTNRGSENRVTTPLAFDTILRKQIPAWKNFPPSDKQIARLVLLHYLQGLQIAALRAAHAQKQETAQDIQIPVPVFYFPESSSNSQSPPNAAPPLEDYRQSKVWEQYNAVAFIKAREFPFGFLRLLEEGHKGTSQNNGFPKGHDSTQEEVRYLLQDWLAEAILNPLFSVPKGEAAPTKQTNAESSADIMPPTLYDALNEIRLGSNTVAMVGVETNQKFYPGLRLRVAWTTDLPDMRHDLWAGEITYLGTPQWGFLKTFMHSFYHEFGPATHLVLLAGPYGTGKTSIAQALSQHLVSVDPPDWYILTPKPEAQALRFLPVDKYNIFHLFREAELSRVTVEERLAEADYYLPRHKNIIINYAELNAATEKEFRNRLGDIEQLLRELREKAIPQRIVVFVAVNYATLYRILPDFLTSKPDLSVGGARLRKVWLIETAQQQIAIQSMVNAHEKQDSNDYFSKVVAEHLERYKKAPERLYLEHYLKHRLYGTALGLQDTLLQRSLLTEVARALINEPYLKEADPEQWHASATLRTRLWVIKAKLMKQALESLANAQERFPLLEEILLNATAGNESAANNSRNRNYDLFLENWGVTRQALIQMLGSDALIRLQLRQGFIRNLTAYLMQEVYLRTLERDIIHLLAGRYGFSNRAKYLEMLTLSEWLEGFIHGLGDTDYSIVAIDKNGKVKALVDNGNPSSDNGNPSSEHILKVNNTKAVAGNPYSTHDNAHFDLALRINNQNGPVHVLVDVTHQDKASATSHHSDKMTVLPGCSQQYCKRKERKEDKNPTFWEYGHEVAGICKGLKANTIFATDIAYLDTHWVWGSEPPRSAFEIQSIAACSSQICPQCWSTTRWKKVPTKKQNTPPSDQ